MEKFIGILFTILECVDRCIWTPNSVRSIVLYHGA